ncbi:DUF1493 family protein [Caulobacter sp. 17J80-11]|uniref:DUF1493 family protein n=1 Tax=Caulobacter sp. 17J80-11 TaxID=2763502 RepID=UPI0016538B85|nr:DUF1493 family protein [Caulobacter sp. 17J80-11]
MSRDEARERVVAKLRELTFLKDKPIADDTEVYADLAIDGDDLEDLARWMAQAFGVDVSRAELGRFAPEAGKPALGWFGLRAYKSLTVTDLLDAVETRRWPSR